MTRRESLTWGVFGGLLVILYLLSSTDLIIKEKKVEIYPVSVVIGDVTDDYYVNFRKGVDQAADEYNVDVSFITLYEEDDPEEQMDLVRREIDDGARAVILEPLDSVYAMQMMDGIAYGSPIIILGGILPSEQVMGAVTTDKQESGRKLADAIMEENTPDIPVYVFARTVQYGSTGEMYRGLADCLTENGYTVVLCEKSGADTYRKVIEGTVYPGNGRAVVAALDPFSTAEAAEIISKSPVYGNYISGLYGVGTLPSVLDQMDKGIIRGMIVSNEFEMGYLCVQKAVEAIEKSGKREQIILDSYYIEREALRDQAYEKILYPID